MFSILETFQVLEAGYPIPVLWCLYDLYDICFKEYNFLLDKGRYPVSRGCGMRGGCVDVRYSPEGLNR